MEAIDMPTTATPSVRPTDFLGVDALLSDEERLIRDTLRQLSSTTPTSGPGALARLRPSWPRRASAWARSSGSAAWW